MLPPVTVLSAFFALLTLVRCQLSLEIDGAYTIYFSRESFQKFQECLCDNKNKGCSAAIRQEYNYGKYFYDVTSTIKEEVTHFAHLYSDSYLCHWFKYTEPSAINCRRLLNDSEADEPQTSDYICQFRLSNLPSTCSIEDVHILWREFQNITKINNVKDYNLCQPLVPTVPSANKLTTTASTTSTFEGQKDGDPSDDNIPLIAGVVVAVVVVFIVTGIIIIICWRRKHNSKPPSTSHHYVKFNKAISHNYENTHHKQEHGNGNGRLSANAYTTAKNESKKADGLELHRGEDVAKFGGCPQDVVQRNGAVAAKNRYIDNQGTEYTSIDEDVSYTVVSPENEYNNTFMDNEGASASSCAPPASATYSRLGEPVRNIQNPYDTLENPAQCFVTKSTSTNSNTTASYSFAGPKASLPSTQDETVHSSTPPSQSTNRNAYSYEEMGVNSMTIPVVSVNDYEESSIQYASGDCKNVAKASKEPDYTNCSVKEFEPAKNDYATLGEPVRNIQNPYDVLVNQKENKP